MKREDRLKLINDYSNGTIERLTYESLVQNGNGLHDLYNSIFNDKEKYLFRPYEFSESSDFKESKITTILLNSLLQYPDRIDIAFEQSWKAFEEFLSISHGLPHTTEKIFSYTDLYTPDNIFEIWKLAPTQAYEFLAKEIKELNKNPFRQLSTNNRISRPCLDIIATYIESLNLENLDPQVRQRKTAFFLKRLLTGETLIVNSESAKLSKKDSFQFLIYALLYMLRNKFLHGDSHPPFISTKASLKTYTLPTFCFIITFLLSGSRFAVSNTVVESNIISNLQNAKKIFGSNWKK